MCGRRNTDLRQRAPHHASAAVAVSTAGPGWRNRDRGDRVYTAPSPTASAAKPVDALAPTRPIARVASPWRTEPARRSAPPTVRKATVVMCHVTWIMALVITEPPKGLEASTPGDSLLTTS